MIDVVFPSFELFFCQTKNHLIKLKIVIDVYKALCARSVFGNYIQEIPYNNLHSSLYYLRTNINIKRHPFPIHKNID